MRFWQCPILTMTFYPGNKLLNTTKIYWFVSDVGSCSASNGLLCSHDVQIWNIDYHLDYNDRSKDALCTRAMNIFSKQPSVPWDAPVTRELACQTIICSSSLPRQTMWYMRTLVPEAGISGRDKSLHPTVNCGMQLLIPVRDTCFWHQSPHMMMYPGLVPRHIMCDFTWGDITVSVRQSYMHMEQLPIGKLNMKGIWISCLFLIMLLILFHLGKMLTWFLFAIMYWVQNQFTSVSGDFSRHCL